MNTRTSIVVCLLASVTLIACRAPPEEAPDTGSAPDADVGEPDAGLSDGEIPGAEVDYTEQREACRERDPLRNLYWGDLHVHTELSFDAYGFKVRNSPADAYEFAKGEALDIPAPRGEMEARTVQLDRPLDFAAVTDHAEYFGEIQLCDDPDSAVYETERCRKLREGGNDDVVSFGTRLAGSDPSRFQDLCGEDGTRCVNRSGTTWERVQRAADEAYDTTASCEFTSLIGYEYTNALRANSLHRNVLFRNGEVPDNVTSTFEAPLPRDLWAQLERQCLEADGDCDVLSIPHNSNQSAGDMFGPFYPGASSEEEEAESARLRRRLEPLFEIYQHKGSAECMLGLSGVAGGADELCQFEKLHRGSVTDCGDDPGFGGLTGEGCVSRWDFWRNTLILGYRERERLGVNPYRLGVVGGTDTHNATPGLVEEADWPGHIGDTDATPKTRLGGAAGGSFTTDGIITSPGGMTGVWAVENSRDAIFDALERRETFATSGPRIAVRMFVGRGLPDEMCERPNFAEIGYRLGVPMGGEVPTDGEGKPKVAVMATKDPGRGEAEGTPLQQLQIIKGVLKPDGRADLDIHTVAGDPDNGATVDTETCQASGPGADSLCAVWTDEEYDPDARTFYYARVVENPTCRWSTRQCNSLPASERPEVCADEEHPETIQERAWGSPVWSSAAD